MAYTRYTGVNMVVQLETSTANFVTLPNITEVRLDDGTPESVEFTGSTYKTVAHGQVTYWIEVDMETDDTNSVLGNTYVCAQVVDRTTEARGVKFYPNGTGEGRYFQLDCLFHLQQISKLGKNDRAMQTLRGDPHVQASLDAGWQGIPEATT